jgi:hypothetical protein
VKAKTHCNRKLKYNNIKVGLRKGSEFEDRIFVAQSTIHFCDLAKMAEDIPTAIKGGNLIASQAGPCFVWCH